MTSLAIAKTHSCFQIFRADTQILCGSKRCGSKKRDTITRVLVSTSNTIWNLKPRLSPRVLEPQPPYHRSSESAKDKPNHSSNHVAAWTWWTDCSVDCPLSSAHCAPLHEELDFHRWYHITQWSVKSTRLFSQTRIPLSLSPFRLLFGFIAGHESYMSLGLVCLNGLGFLFRSQTRYRISHKAGG